MANETAIDMLKITRCPGFLYGNEYNVTVETRKYVKAALWLRRRRIGSYGTRLSKDGVVIQIRES